MTTRTVFRLTLIAIALMTPLAGCGGDGDGGMQPGVPSVTLTAPSDAATVNGTILITANASNAEAVRFLVDGAAIGEDTSAPYEASWNTTQSSDGSHTLTAVAEGAGGTVQDEISVTVDNTVAAVTLSVSPLSATVNLGRTQQFNATVTNATDTSVTWSVVEGSAFGSVNASGLFTAPAGLPSPAAATVRATSVADPTKSATATVTLQDPGSSSTLGAAMTEAYSGTRTIGSLSFNGVETAAQAVFTASLQNGGALTTTGTLTQTAPGSDDFTWTGSPNDKLVIAFADGSRIDLVVSAFQGDFSGNWETFRDFHSNLDFTSTSAGAFDVRIQSQSGSPTALPGLPPTAGLTQFSRTVTGTVRLNGTDITVNITDSGQVDSEFGGGSVDYRSVDTVIGTLSSTNGTVTVNESYTYRFLSVSNAIEQWTQTNASRVVVDGDTYELQNVLVRGTCSNNLVAESDFWVAQGMLLKNGAAFGTVEFEAFPSVGLPCPGPKPVIRLGSGEVIPL